MSLFSRFTGLFRRRAIADELDAELRSHIEMRTELNIAGGMSPAKARDEALRRFGNVALTKEEARSFDLFRCLESIAQDARYGLRNLRRKPSFGMVTVLVLALGIAANTVVFSIVNGTLLNPLPYPKPDRLIFLTLGNNSSISYPNFLDLQSQASAFEAITLFRFESTNLEIKDATTRVSTCMATADLFRVFGVEPLLGRFFTPEDDHLGASPVTVISERAWRDRFAADPGIIGRPITLGSTVYTIIGVAPASFRYLSTPVYLPLGQWSDKRFQSRDGTFGTRAIARLKDGVTMGRLNSELTAIAQRLSNLYPDIDSGLRFEATSLAAVTVAGIKPMALLFSAAVGLVLLIACANVATLMLARFSFRRREFAIRAALGAGRLRMVRQLLTESITVALVGGVAGVLMAHWGIRGALALLPYSLPPDANIGLDLRVLLFAVVTSVLAGTLFGVFPAFFTTQKDTESALHGIGRSTPRGHERLQQLMICSEFAIAVVLVTATALLLRSLDRLSRVELGFDPHHVITFNLGLPGDSLADPARARMALRRAIDQLAALPGIEAVAVNLGNLPLTGESDVPLWRTDKPRPASQRDMAAAEWYAVSPRYLQTLSIQLRRGRFFDERDAAGSVPVVVLSDSAARKLFPKEDPRGQQLHLEFFDQTAQVVGLVGDVKQFGPAEGDVPGVYIPVWQVPDRLLPLLGRFAAVALRSKVPIGSVLPSVRRTIQTLDPHQVVYGVNSMDDLISSEFSMQRASGTVLAAFAMFSVLLAATGIYGLVAYIVGQRTYEIGLRMALGARPGSVLRMMLLRGVRMVAIGLVVGALVTPVFVRLLKSMLFGVHGGDPLTMTAAGLLLVIVGVAAAYIPARRAARIDPMVALRQE